MEIKKQTQNRLIIFIGLTIILINLYYIYQKPPAYVSPPEQGETEQTVKSTLLRGTRVDRTYHTTALGDVRLIEKSDYADQPEILVYETWWESPTSDLTNIGKCNHLYLKPNQLASTLQAGTKYELTVHAFNIDEQGSINPANNDGSYKPWILDRATRIQ